ncbi:MAG: molecular chaperone DnaJ [Sphingomonadaceae bacterium]|uniref:molecular chaperone DnaJ n=1 Tax=Thermaurantiacus sp. TaxID=2820283 RepID=UPI00298EFA0B|nr:molecular chaperone DnaJ [Thermaurantiacus sp.]MCS6986986.1 molecular chaperone DnaJ [Sphingomonadaceae bacterium]MDW8415413.1 molecular chaperone DnaJ [Thermaurantiacus sp.]
MSAEMDYYELLGVSRDADEATLKAAYRKAALKWHPDRNPGNPEAEARFKAVNEAWEVLKDPQKRAAYDRFGRAAFTGGAPGSGPFGPGMDDLGGFAADIFETFFGDVMGRGRTRRPQRGADVRYDLEVSFEDAFHGREVEIAYTAAATCEACNGSGGRPGSRLVACPTCGGRGTVRMQNGLFVVERTCPSCGGEGTRLSDPCPACGGEGRVERPRTVKVRIPPGVDDGTRIRLAGEGEAGPRGAPPGDLYIFVHLKPHPFWKRDGTTLYAQVPLSFVTAALGGEIRIPGLDGQPVEIRLPPGTQSGRQFRVRGRGFPSLNGGGPGDLVIQVELETPTRLTPRQRELLEEFRRIEEKGEASCPRSRGFFERMKAVWDGLTE